MKPASVTRFLNLVRAQGEVPETVRQRYLEREVQCTDRRYACPRIFLAMLGKRQ